MHDWPKTCLKNFQISLLSTWKSDTTDLGLHNTTFLLWQEFKGVTGEEMLTGFAVKLLLISSNRSLLHVQKRTNKYYSPLVIHQMQNELKKVADNTVSISSQWYIEACFWVFLVIVTVCNSVFVPLHLECLTFVSNFHLFKMVYKMLNFIHIIFKMRETRVWDLNSVKFQNLADMSVSFPTKDCSFFIKIFNILFIYTTLCW